MFIFLFSFAVVLITLYWVGNGIRALARKEKPFYWLFVPANRFALIVTNEAEKKAEGEVGNEDDAGGNLVDVLHSVPGKWLDKRDSNPMNWKFESFDEEHPVDPTHSGYIFDTLGVQKMGLFRTPKRILEKRLRYTRKEGETATHTIAKDKKRNTFHYSGEQTVSILDADTNDGLGIDVDIDFIFERVFPVRAMIRLADSASFLDSKIEEMVNLITAKYPASDFFHGNNVSARKKEIAEAVEQGVSAFKTEILQELGIEITEVNLRSVGAKAEHRKLIELETKAELEGKAKVVEAEARKKAKILDNDADADHIARVVRPAAENELTVRVREAEAYENNKTVTTFVEGGGAGILVGEKK